MSTIDEIRSVLIVIEPLLSLAAVAQRITGAGGPPAAEGLAMLAAAVKAWEDGGVKIMTLDEVTAEEKREATADAQLDAAEDAKLAAKFPVQP